ncbi:MULTISPECIES: hypothetical protein [Hafnia]|uniref:Uncharacterized protein n=1 Tax=Hafnia alvei ATCC 51873 TaxID=1002364 RepID=G9YA99_HAFAL|nr:hypothetical protein [Hafnia alvei]EHM40229.1 hypothetical protein HMPREF0454_03520 [Hafnia alvei ATCC 51873]QQE45344.1 hypothetical protein I6H95_08685 [Hafnia alvei]
MNEKDVVNLYRSLSQCRDSFMQDRAKFHQQQPVARNAQRERELRECMRNR